MNPFIALLKREFRENRSIFLFVPVVISVFMVLMMALSLFVFNVDIRSDSESSVINGSTRHEIGVEPREESRVIGPIREVHIAKIRELAASGSEYRASTISRYLGVLSAPVRIVLIFVIFYYLLGALYDERRNRSILFWKSMPVSDCMTVGSKMMAALVIAPLIALACIAFTQICALLIASVLAPSADADIWSVIWSPARLFAHWSFLISFFVVQVIWSWPVICWVVLVSSFARAIPMMWAIGIPIGLIVAEKMLLPVEWMGDFMARHLKFYDGMSVAAADFDVHQITGMFTDVELWIGVLIGSLFVYGAIWKRGIGDES